MRFVRYLLLFLSLLPFAVAGVTVRDHSGRDLALSSPAKNIISTAPHITELLFWIGGGGHIAGVTSYSDFPAEAAGLPQVGDNRQIDVERVLALKPDLLIAWTGGNPVRQIARLEKSGLPVFYSDIQRIEDIPKTMEQFAVLIGKAESGHTKAQEWRAEMQALTRQYAGKAPLSVFYQVSEKPLYTLNGRHIVSEAIRVCGGKNIFSDSAVIAPQVDLESVLQVNPDVILITGHGGNQAGKDGWMRFGFMNAVKNRAVHEINADLIDRPGPRFIEGVRLLCEILETVRSKAN